MPVGPLKRSINIEESQGTQIHSADRQPKARVFSACAGGAYVSRRQTRWPRAIADW